MTEEFLTANLTTKRAAPFKCARDNERRTTQRQFWKWISEGIIDVIGQNPLTEYLTKRNSRRYVVERIHPRSFVVGQELKKKQIQPAMAEETEPPRFTESLLYMFLSKQECENVIGDLLEEYKGRSYAVEISFVENKGLTADGAACKLLILGSTA